MDRHVDDSLILEQRVVPGVLEHGGDTSIIVEGTRIRNQAARATVARARVIRDTAHEWAQDHAASTLIPKVPIRDARSSE